MKGHRAFPGKALMRQFCVESWPQWKWVLVGDEGVKLRFKWKFRPCGGDELAPRWGFNAKAFAFM